jgi:hypothetical protein
MLRERLDGNVQSFDHLESDCQLWIGSTEADSPIQPVLLSDNGQPLQDLLLDSRIPHLFL